MLPATTDNIFFGCLSPADRIRYSRTSRTAYLAVKSYSQRAFRIHNHLSRFFTDTEIHYFRYWQSRTGMFISGSTALQFFDRALYTSSDLDIYVEHRYCKPVAFWLESIGYTFVHRNSLYQSEKLEEALEETLPSDIDIENLPEGFFESKSMGYFGRGVANVYNFHKSKQYSTRKIQLITSYYSSLEIVLNFHSTCVMNLITHERAYSLYPYATFEERRSLVISTEGSKQEAARQKYERRGWTMVKTGQDEDIRNPGSDFTQCRRYVGDSRCWTIPVLPKLDLPEDFMATNTWELKYRPGVEYDIPGHFLTDPTVPLNVKLTGKVDPKINFTILRSQNLRFSYLVVDKSVQDFLTPALLQSLEKGGIFYDEDIKKLLHWDRQHSMPLPHCSETVIQIYSQPK